VDFALWIDRLVGLLSGLCAAFAIYGGWLCVRHLLHARPKPSGFAAQRPAPADETSERLTGKGEVNTP
jgi:hypothetical protein